MIKEKLKLYGLTLSSFSEHLHISRPPLDNYIRLYENGMELPNKRYSRLFDALFDSGALSISAFYETLERFTSLLAQEKILGVSGFDEEYSDILGDIVAIARRDMKREECDLRLYHFITMLMNNYYTVPVFQHLASYFLTLNGITDISEITEDEKIAFSNYYPLFKSEVTNNLQLDRLQLLVFYQRVQEIKEEKEHTAETIRQQLLEIINEKIERQLQQGVDIHNIDIQKMLT